MHTFLYCHTLMPCGGRATDTRSAAGTCILLLTCSRLLPRCICYFLQQEYILGPSHCQGKHAGTTFFSPDDEEARHSRLVLQCITVKLDRQILFRLYLHSKADGGSKIAWKWPRKYSCPGPKPIAPLQPSWASALPRRLAGAAPAGAATHAESCVSYKGFGAILTQRDSLG